MTITNHPTYPHHDDTCPTWCAGRGDHELYIEDGSARRSHAVALEDGWFLYQLETLHMNGRREFTPLEAFPPSFEHLRGRDEMRAAANRLLELAQLADLTEGDEGAIRMALIDGPNLFTSPPREATPRLFTWRDLPEWETYGRNFTWETRPRGDLGVLDELAEPSTGGILLHNETDDLEGGHFIMLDGLNAEEQRQTVKNVGWETSCGLVYSRRRTGREPYKPAHLVFVDSQQRTWFAWAIDSQVTHYRR